jgi:hypothetical protein
VRLVLASRMSTTADDLGAELVPSVSMFFTRPRAATADYEDLVCLAELGTASIEFRRSGWRAGGQ